MPDSAFEKPRFLSVSDLLRISTENTLRLLKLELEIRLEALRQQQEQHRRELVNSVELEGRISAVVKAYEAGYEQGMKQYLVEKGLLGDFEK